MTLRPEGKCSYRFLEEFWLQHAGLLNGSFSTSRKDGGRRLLIKGKLHNQDISFEGDFGPIHEAKSMKCKVKILLAYNVTRPYENRSTRQTSSRSLLPLFIGPCWDVKMVSNT